MPRRFTDKKLKNKKFREIEHAIAIAYFSAKTKINIRHLIKTAKISRSTFYRHHQTIYAIVPDYEDYILRQYKSFFRCLRKNVKIKNLYERTLIFIYIHQEIMNFLLKYGQKDLIEEMILILSPHILTSSQKINREILDIYIKEIAAVLEKWQSDGYKKDEILKTVDKIMYLTETASSRLSPIANFDREN
ncbi:TetR/AcrR family transcriptional regulator [Candidatus Saccharibacteria bacterium]|nr:TetR/AcrR family transcriptional regulator [Candidatus Saccharibacteria bacterium]